MHAVKFVADKIPRLDSVWDAAHRFVRLPAGALLATSVYSDGGVAARIFALVAGGALAGEAPLPKAATRAILYASPEPIANWIASLSEGLVATGSIVLALHNPTWYLSMLVVFVAVGAVARYFVWRGVRTILRRIGIRFETV